MIEKKLPKIEEGFLSLSVGKKFKGLYNIWKENGSGWLVELRTEKGVRAAEMHEVSEIYQKRYPDKEIKLKIY